ncbi:MAG: metal-sensitive transcriptional regulator [Candidatus Saccharimonadales bacterium]
MAEYGYTHKKDEITKRLRRAEGQVRGIARMVDEDKYCIDILTQITAIQAALDKVGLELLSEHAKHCLTNPKLNTKELDAKADELVGAVSRMLSR